MLYESSSDGENDDNGGDSDSADVIDVEDLGTMVDKMHKAKKQRITKEPKEMITPLLRKALTKQGAC